VIAPLTCRRINRELKLLIAIRGRSEIRRDVEDDAVKIRLKFGKRADRLVEIYGFRGIRIHECDRGDPQFP